MGLFYLESDKEGFIFLFECMVFYWLLGGLRDYIEVLIIGKIKKDIFKVFDGDKDFDLL